MKKKSYYLILIFIIILINEYVNYKSFIYILFNKIKKGKLLIEVDVSGSKGKRGPSIFIKGLKDILPYNTSNCFFIASNNNYPISRENKTNFFFFQLDGLAKKFIINGFMKKQLVNLF